VTVFDSVVMTVIVFVSLAGIYGKALSVSGGVAAVFTGLTIYWAANWKGLVVLGAFFFSSSLLSKWKAKVKEPSEKRLAKGSRRDWQQVLANGGPAVLFILIYHFEKDIQWLWAFTAAIAAANSDTWASEIGVAGKKKPISVKTWKQVEKGVSGAVSFAGTAGAVGGAVWIAMIAYILYSPSLLSTICMAMAGFFGNVIDTFLGAFFQSEYVCPVCGIQTEKRFHCGENTILRKGHPFFNNETVNFLSSLLGGLLAWVLI
jgi:uncharacterized protein (TIGR00297 family)